jgi:hypothetical protein
MGMFAHSYVVFGSSPEELLSFYRADGTRAVIFLMSETLMPFAMITTMNLT